MPKLWTSKLPTLLRLPSAKSRCPLQVRFLTLAYDLHRPPAQKEAKHAPIIIMHGLFGSKQNNRSISK